MSKKGMIAEFKEFISRGSVLDMAVGIIIGSAFTAIVTSLVGDIITPVIGIITGGVDFSSLSVKIGEAAINYGAFIQSIISFFLIALCVFLLVKGINSLHRKKDEPATEEPPAPPEPSKEELLLTEIRDLLRENARK